MFRWPVSRPRGTADRIVVPLCEMAMAVSSSALVPVRLRVIIWRLLGADIRTIAIAAGCTVTGRPSRLRIDHGSSVNVGCSFDLTAPISIGCDTYLGPQVMLCAGTHQIGETNRRAGATLGRPISIGSGCWIGARTVILGGVTIGKGCVVGAGAVVARDCEPNGLYVGVPARRHRDLPTITEVLPHQVPR